MNPSPGSRSSAYSASTTNVTGRWQRIYRVVRRIPKGRVATYGQVATEAGLPRRARLVGHALSHLPQGTKLPWHRVINARGEISQRGGGEREQAKRLRREGVAVDRRGRVDLSLFRWEPDW